MILLVAYFEDVPQCTDMDRVLIVDVLDWYWKRILIVHRDLPRPNQAFVGGNLWTTFVCNAGIVFRPSPGFAQFARCLDQQRQRQHLQIAQLPLGKFRGQNRHSLLAVSSLLRLFPVVSNKKKIEHTLQMENKYQ